MIESAFVESQLINTSTNKMSANYRLDEDNFNFLTASVNLFVLWSINVLGQLATFHSSPLRQAVAPSLSCFFLTPLPPATLLYLLICLSTKRPCLSSPISSPHSPPSSLLRSHTSLNLYLAPSIFIAFCLFFFAYCAGHFVCLWHMLSVNQQRIGHPFTWPL